MSTPWDHLRAALIVVHLVLITVAAVPAPNGMLTEARKRNPTTIEAIAPWARLVVTLGLADDEPAARDWLFDRGAELTKARWAVLGPGNKWLRFSGTAQSWRMFGAAPTRHGRLEVHGQLAGSDEWIPLFIDSDNRHQWNARLLNQNRTRSLRSNWSDKQMRAGYIRFARFLARQAFEDHPELAQVRIREQGITIPPPAVLRETGRLKLDNVYWTVLYEPGDVR